MIELFWVVLWVLSMISAYYMARYKRRSVVWWVFWSFVFGWFPVLVLVLLPKFQEDKMNELLQIETMYANKLIDDQEYKEAKLKILTRE